LRSAELKGGDYMESARFIVRDLSRSWSEARSQLAYLRGRDGRAKTQRWSARVPRTRAHPLQHTPHMRNLPRIVASKRTKTNDKNTKTNNFSRIPVKDWIKNKHKHHEGRGDRDKG
jgi:hypothetical protein